MSDPAPAPADAHKRRLLEAVLWVLLAVTATSAAAAALEVRVPWSQGPPWLSVLVGLIYGGALVALRLGHLRVAAHVLVAGVVLGSWASMIGPEGATGGASFVFVAANVLVAALAIHARAGAAVAALDAVAMILWQWRTSYGASQLLEGLVILAIFTTIALAVAQHNDSARRILGQAHGRLEETLAIQEALARNSADAILTIASDGQVLACNHAARQWAMEHGVPAVAKGVPFEEAVPPELHSQMRGLLEEARSAGAVGSELAWNSHGGPWWVQMFLHTLSGGTVAVQLRDVTQERRGQLHEHKTHREQSELEKLQDLERFRMRLLHTASHELRNPITPLRLQLSLLERRLPKEVDVATHRSLEVMRRNVDRLALLADDLVDVARLEDGKMALAVQTVDLDAFVQRELQGYEAVADQRDVGLTITAHSGATVQADPARLAQVLTNLVTNAIKFNKRGGHIDVRTRWAGSEAVVEVHDDGTGFPAHKQEALFQPFSQLHNGSARRQGSGLGLYICKGIIEAHGGRIWGTSMGTGQGAAFCLALPAAAPRATFKGSWPQVPCDD